MNDTMQNLMREATRLTQSGNLMEATAAIQRALGNARGAPMPPAPAPIPASAAIILDGCVFEVAQPGAGRPDSASPESARRAAEAPTAPVAETSRGSANSHTCTAAGAFTEGSHTHASLTRRYKLYTPPGVTGYVGKGLPLVVMLHGCTQNPDDFAAGTGMNELAREQGFCVLYPAQSADANPQRCWNWFKHTHQSRGRGEAALLASMTLSVIQQHGIDARRVYIAGLSAGGAMAAIVAAAYPEIYAAAGVHSGLAVGAASNVSEALAAMRSGAKPGAQTSAIGGENGGARGGAGGGAGGGRGLGQTGDGSAVPTIIFHGDQDHTVHPRNGEQVSEQAVAAVQLASGHSVTKAVEHGVSRGGRRFTRSIHRSSSGQTIAEHWLVSGAGHAWAGGRASGSYTDPKGPDATGEMLRFFLAHQQPENN